ncbi:uncharacterized protein N7484_008147 [Penicillium longicatenatum]|uniref:uncharacterized protein n=1 Tax=Penicillium longicatenatum TaxID=1561947 RepID=UPI0025475E29|nr:uncharacterized protein N7484_008147 [Penicillium longicatenatum]KAJ5640285.1 hypothetical protein N7484_008147 [Penicillium longicatenatum]
MQPFNLAKEREFYKYLPRDHSVYPFAPFDDASQNIFVPRPSQDHALTAFAQLGAIKLDAKRAMISLFGRTHQYVLAEATGTTSRDNHDGLWLGCCVLPKEKGLCKDVANLPLSEPSDNPAIVGGSAFVMPDVRNNECFQNSGLSHRFSEARFYAGVPIISPRGITIGSYCVLDTQPRKSGLEKPLLTFMEGMAITIMEYLDTAQSKHRNRQSERMIVGLGSFVEGRATLRNSWDEAHLQDAATGQSGETVEGQLNKHQQDLQEAHDYSGHQNLPYRELETDSLQPRASSKDLPNGTSSGVTMTMPSSTVTSTETLSDPNQDRGNKKDGRQQHKTSFRATISGHDVPNDVVPAALTSIFSRAANLIRESIEVEGVAFLDASIESFGGLVEDGSRKAREAYERDATSSSDGSTTESETPPSTRRLPVPNIENDDTTICRTLGSSTSKASSIDDLKPNHDFAMRESLLRAILNRYPHGKIFNYNESGSLSDDSTSSSGTYRNSGRTSGPKTKRKRRRPNHRQDANDLITVLIGARSIIFLPLWDSHKSKWFSGVLVWTITPKRVFTPESELAYLRAFGNSVMAEVHRLDIEMAEKAKTKLVSSISHELRSPLHGILGTANILCDTAMNALQQGMVHTIESCGRTLLDTINHVLDFTYIDKFKNDSAKKKHAYCGKQLDVPDQPKPNLERNPPRTSDNSHAPVQLDAVLEEVMESMFAGHSFYNDPLARSRDVGPSNSTSIPPKPVAVIFDIQEAAEWTVLTKAGCWRRILMNVFGNALKYTPSGFIYVGLKVSPLPHSESDDCTVVKPAGDHTSQYLVTLTVKDTGKGIDVNYLRNDLFTPFSQEDALAPGSGLGLSIVREALVSLGGSIDVTSEKNYGTELSIEVPLSLVPMPDNTSDDSSSHSSERYNSIRNLAQGKTLCLIGFGSSLETERDITLYKSLERLCRDWFHLTVKAVTVDSAFLRRENTPSDFYLMVQTGLDNPDFEGNELLNSDRLTNGEQGGVSPLIVICQSPEAAHNMSVRATGRNRESAVEFISQPCGPRKLAKALDMCMHRREDQASEAGANEPTRWVELPESSYLPLDIGPRDPPDERLKISKRPTAGVIANRDNENCKSAPKGQIENDTLPSEESSPPENTVTQQPDNSQPSVLLVDDNEVNLKLLVAFVKKEGWSFMTASNGLEAVKTYQAHPGKFGAIITDISMPIMDGFEATQEIRRFEREYWSNNASSNPPPGIRQPLRR